MRFSTRGIVLCKENFGEADQYIQFITQDVGVITALAKSSRKSKRRYVGGLDLFTHDEIFLKGNPRERAYLNELVVLNSFPILRESFDKLMIAGTIAQWIRRLANHPSPMPNVYRLFGQTLTLLEKEADIDRLHLISLIFRLKLLSEVGLRPRTESCARCEGTSQLLYFDLSTGGMVCSPCSVSQRMLEAVRLESDEHQFLQIADEIRLSSISDFHYPKERLQKLTRLATQFASYHTHQKLPG